MNDPFGDCPDCKDGDHEGQTQEAYASWYSVTKTKYHWYSGGGDKAKAGWKEADEYVNIISKHINVNYDQQNGIQLSTDLDYGRVEDGILEAAANRAISIAMPSNQVYLNRVDENGKGIFVLNPNFKGHGIESLYSPEMVLPWGRILGAAGKGIKAAFFAGAMSKPASSFINVATKDLILSVAEKEALKAATGYSRVRIINGTAIIDQFGYFTGTSNTQINLIKAALRNNGATSIKIYTNSVNAKMKTLLLSRMNSGKEIFGLTIKKRIGPGFILEGGL